MKELRIIIAGGRDFSDYEKLKKDSLSAIKDCAAELYGKEKIVKNLITIISGTANGADKLGEEFAQEFGLSLKMMPADWSKNGKRAGYMRNIEMAEFATSDNSNAVLIAFWDGKSRGTEHMISTAFKCEMKVFINKY